MRRADRGARAERHHRARGLPRGGAPRSTSDPERCLPRAPRRGRPGARVPPTRRCRAGLRLARRARRARRRAPRRRRPLGRGDRVARRAAAAADQQPARELRAAPRSCSPAATRPAPPRSRWTRPPRPSASRAPLDAADARLLAGRALAAAGDTEPAKAALQRVAADAGRGGALRLRDAAARELRRLGTPRLGREPARQLAAPVPTSSPSASAHIAELVAEGHVQQAGRRHAVPQREDRAKRAHPRLRQARRPVALAAHAPARGAQVTARKASSRSAVSSGRSSGRKCPASSAAPPTSGAHGRQTSSTSP